MSDIEDWQREFDEDSGEEHTDFEDAAPLRTPAPRPSQPSLQEQPSLPPLVPVAALPALPAQPASPSSLPLHQLLRHTLVSSVLSALLGEPSAHFHVPAPGLQGAAQRAAARQGAVASLLAASGPPSGALALPTGALHWSQHSALAALPPAQLYFARSIAGALHPLGSWEAVRLHLLSPTASAAPAQPSTALTVHTLRSLLDSACQGAFQPITLCDPGQPAAPLLQACARVASHLSWLQWCANCVLQEEGSAAAPPPPAAAPSHLHSFLLPLLDAAAARHGAAVEEEEPGGAWPTGMYGATSRALARCLAEAVASLRLDVAALAAFHTEWLSSNAHRPSLGVEPQLTLVGLVCWLKSHEELLDTLTRLACQAFFSAPPPVPVHLDALDEHNALPAALAWAALHGPRWSASQCVSASLAALERASLSHADSKAEGGSRGPAVVSSSSSSSNSSSTARHGLCLQRWLGHFPPAPLVGAVAASTAKAVLRPYLAACDAFMHGRVSNAGAGTAEVAGEGGVLLCQELPFIGHGSCEEALACVTPWVAAAAAECGGTDSGEGESGGYYSLFGLSDMGWLGESTECSGGEGWVLLKPFAVPALGGGLALMLRIRASRSHLATNAQAFTKDLLLKAFPDLFSNPELQPAGLKQSASRLLGTPVFQCLPDIVDTALGVTWREAEAAVEGCKEEEREGGEERAVGNEEELDEMEEEGQGEEGEEEDEEGSLAVVPKALFDSPSAAASRRHSADPAPPSEVMAVVVPASNSGLSVSTRAATSLPPPAARQKLAYQPVPILAKAVLGPGIAPLPGKRLSAWWSIDAQVEVKKEPKEVDGGDPAAAAAAAAPLRLEGAPLGHGGRAARALNISVIKEEEEEEGESSDEEGWASQFADEAASVDSAVLPATDSALAAPAAAVPEQVLPEAASSHTAAACALAPEQPVPPTQSSAALLLQDATAALVPAATAAASAAQAAGAHQLAQPATADLEDAPQGWFLPAAAEASPGAESKLEVEDPWALAEGSWLHLCSIASSGEATQTSSQSEWHLLKASSSPTRPALLQQQQQPTSTPPSSLACEPLSHCLQRDLVGPLRAQNALLSRLLAAQMVHPQGGDLVRHMWAIRAVFFLEQGQALSLFLERVFASLGVGSEAQGLLPPPPSGSSASSPCPPRASSAPHHSLGLTSTAVRSSSRLTEWLRASLGTPGPHLQQQQAWHLTPAAFSALFTGYQAATPTELVCHGLQLVYHPPFLASLLLPPPTLQAYAQVTGVLLGLTMAMKGLQMLAHASRHVEATLLARLACLAPPGLPAHAPRLLHCLRCALRVRALALATLTSLHAYVAQGVVVAPWAAFCRGAAAAGSLDELAAAQDSYLRAIQGRCLLGPTQGTALAHMQALLAKASALEAATLRFYSVALAAVDSIVGLAEEGAEARAYLGLAGSSSSSSSSSSERPPHYAPKRRLLECDLNVQAHAAECFAQVSAAFTHVQASGRGVERQCALFKEASKGIML